MLSTSGCLRYIPSYAELAAENESAADEGNADHILKNREAFFKFESDQRSRLDLLLNSRQGLLTDPAASQYRIGTGDLLELAVFDVPELTRKVRVQPNGILSLPLIGEVQASGLTEAELQNTLQQRLTEFMHHPQVDIFIAEYAAHKISVIGEVARPGTLPLRKGVYSLTDALSEAGGRTQRASGTVIVVPAAASSATGGVLPQAGTNIPPNTPELGLKPKVFGGLKTAAEIAQQSAADAATAGRLADARGSFAPPTFASNGIEIPFDYLVGSVQQPPVVIPLVAGDTIIVPEAGTVQVDGEVFKPGAVPLNAKTSLLGAIASAGGLTYSAKVGEVEVMRDLGDGNKALIIVDVEKIGLGKQKDIRLRDGDVVRIPSDESRFVRRQVVDAINGLFNVGVSGGVR